MGIESTLTRSSWDGGIDVVAFENQPVLGEKVVVQAKPYRHAVGVSAVRDWSGTRMNKGVIKGILETTHRYGARCVPIYQDHPIELIDGGDAVTH